MKKLEVMEKYKGKLLAYTNHTSFDRKFYSEDLSNEDLLVELFDGIHNYDYSLTREGFDFLEEYYGFASLIAILKKRLPEFPYDYDMSVEDYVRGLQVD